MEVGKRVREGGGNGSLFRYARTGIAQKIAQKGSIKDVQKSVLKKVSEKVVSEGPNGGC